METGKKYLISVLKRFPQGTNGIQQHTERGTLNLEALINELANQQYISEELHSKIQSFVR